MSWRPTTPMDAWSPPRWATWQNSTASAGSSPATRSYPVPTNYPALGAVDGLFAHLWFGRSCALHSEPPLSDAFCQFCLDLSPRRILLTHLNEYGRDANEFWDLQHARKIMPCLHAGSPRIEVSAHPNGRRGSALKFPGILVRHPLYGRITRTWRGAREAHRARLLSEVPVGFNSAVGSNPTLLRRAYNF